MTRCTTFWQKARRYPPALIRILARHPRGRLLSDEDISKASGLTINEVRLLGGSMQWAITVDAMERFLRACSIDFENRGQMQRIGSYLRNNPKWLHLRNDPQWESRWKPAIILIGKHISEL